MSRLSLEVGRLGKHLETVDISIGLSRQNESFAAHVESGARMLALDTFSSSAGAVTQAWRIPELRRCLGHHLQARRVQAVVELMPHVWSPFLVSTIQHSGARYLPIVHDVERHPGDFTGLVTGWIGRVLRQSNRVLTLSATTTERLCERKIVPRSKIDTLFHPDLVYAPAVSAAHVSEMAPLRLLFLGRIMAYKGLSVFLDAVDALRARGTRVEVGVFGEGSLGADADRLRHPDCEVVNRWLSEEEIAQALARYQVVVASHIEASQSGVVAAAFGALRPVVVTPVGALSEQVIDGVTGAVASDIEGKAVADAILRLTGDPARYQRIVGNIQEMGSQRSVEAFIAAIARAALSS